MRIGAALNALDFIIAGMPELDRRGKLNAFASVQALLERLRAIARSNAIASGLINAQLLKVQFSAETLAGLGGPGSEERQMGDVRAALDALAGPDCFGPRLDALE